MTMRKSTFVLIILTMAFLFFIFGYLIAQQTNSNTYSIVSEHESTAANSAVSVSGKVDVVTLNLNTATADELAALPEMTAKLAANIIDYRNTYGNFARVENLLRVDGITRSIYLNIEQHLYIG